MSHSENLFARWARELGPRLLKQGVRDLVPILRAEFSLIEGVPWKGQQFLWALMSAQILPLRA